MMVLNYVKTFLLLLWAYWTFLNKLDEASCNVFFIIDSYDFLLASYGLGLVERKVWTKVDVLVFLKVSNETYVFWRLTFENFLFENCKNAAWLENLLYFLEGLRYCWLYLLSFWLCELRFCGWRIDWLWFWFNVNESR